MTGPAVRDPAGSGPAAGPEGRGTALRSRPRLRRRARPGTARRPGDLPHGTPRHRAGARASRVALAAVLALAATGQVRVWATGRGLWGDELAISINLQERAFTELAGRLLYYQVAPVGWLATGKAILLGLGDDERLLRLPSLVAGLLTLALVAVVAGRAVGRWAAVAAVGLVGATPAVLYYAGELKQYSVETAAGMALVVTGAALARRHRRRAWWPVPAAAAVAVAAVLLSYSALVVLAGVVVGAVTHLALQRRWRTALAVAAAMAPAGLLGARLAWHRRSLPLHPEQERFFPTGFPAPGGGPRGVLRWLPEMWSGLVANPLGWNHPWWTLLLVAAGLVALTTGGRRRWAAILGGVLAAATGAAALHGLPMADRVALYLVPVILLLAVAGLAGLARACAHLARRCRLRHAAVPTAAAVALALTAAAGPPLGDGLAEVTHPRVRDFGREALWTVARRLQPGDVVVAYHFSHKTIRWYGPRTGVTAAGLLRLVPGESPDCRPERLEEVLAGARRVWYVYGARWSRHPGDYQVRVARAFMDRGRVAAMHDYGRASGGWILVDLHAGPVRRPLPAGSGYQPPPVPPDPALDCLTVD